MSYIFFITTIVTVVASTSASTSASMGADNFAMANLDDYHLDSTIRYFSGFQRHFCLQTVDGQYSSFSTMHHRSPGCTSAESGDGICTSDERVKGIPKRRLDEAHEKLAHTEALLQTELKSDHDSSRLQDPVTTVRADLQAALDQAHVSKAPHAFFKYICLTTNTGSHGRFWTAMKSLINFIAAAGSPDLTLQAVEEFRHRLLDVSEVVPDKCLICALLYILGDDYKLLRSDIFNHDIDALSIDDIYTKVMKFTGDHHLDVHTSTFGLNAPTIGTTPTIQPMVLHAATSSALYALILATVFLDAPIIFVAVAVSTTTKVTKRYTAHSSTSRNGPTTPTYIATSPINSDAMIHTRNTTTGVIDLEQGHFTVEFPDKSQITLTQRGHISGLVPVLIIPQAAQDILSVCLLRRSGFPITFALQRDTSHPTECVIHHPNGWPLQNYYFRAYNTSYLASCHWAHTPSHATKVLGQNNIDTYTHCSESTDN
ncbi:hypothetical protein SARC_08762 [Sphaeroforma arctica JP610]|uniref:Uncharacterized protein n=1 Tax=Sphaeroforma arctica JP610 TaxID=667725 RepID=A0A0L0FPT4_9EUKA|nr:hypothetical protein SARC_08762 [Sphaeroforma arctica JP610]KNC78820.1 hypothetical protein SARC_08762 [Sphaeroforma arctica JP610]|eukprot:XP_014152722.1 hypothetical protein SARC_08762 [Sphaeroforma arctica JP610]